MKKGVNFEKEIRKRTFSIGCYDENGARKEMRDTKRIAGITRPGKVTDYGVMGSIMRDKSNKPRTK